MASWGSCDFHELRDLNERIKAAASEQEMDAFYTGLLDEMMNGLLTDVKELTPVDRGQARGAHQATNLFHYTAIPTATKGTKGFDGLDTCLSAPPPESSTPTPPRRSTCPPRRPSTPATRPCSICSTSSSPKLDSGVPTAHRQCGAADQDPLVRRRAGYLTHAEDAFGRQMSSSFMDMRYYYDTAEKKENRSNCDYVA